MSTILEDLAALKALGVRLRELAVEPPCEQCEPGKPCFWHRTRKDRDRKICDAKGGESQA